MDKYTEVRKRFEENADPENAVKMAKYMRNRFIFYGKRFSERREKK